MRRIILVLILAATIASCGGSSGPTRTLGRKEACARIATVQNLYRDRADLPAVDEALNDFKAFSERISDDELRQTLGDYMSALSAWRVDPLETTRAYQKLQLARPRLAEVCAGA